MSNVFIFAIGGTGSRVLRSLSFCLASGMRSVPNDTTFVPIIIDFDKRNGDKKIAVDILKNYYDTRSIVYQNVNPDNDDRSFFSPKIEPLSNIGVVNEGVGGDVGITSGINFEFNFQHGVHDSTTNQTFADYLNYSNMMGQESVTKDLLSSLYNDEHNADFSELFLDLERGFKGNPNIGSVIFDDIRNEPDFRMFLARYNPITDKVFVIASVFGGTGSAGFPSIIDAIRYSGIAGADTSPIGASIIFPYFAVNTPHHGGAIHSNIFNSKQKAALSYYNKHDANQRSLYDKLTSAYFVGDTVSTNLDYSEGEDAQKNPANFVEMIAALSIIDFVGNANPHKYNEFGYAGPVVKPPTTISVMDTNVKSIMFDYISRMALAYRYYSAEVKTGHISPNTAYYRGLGLPSNLSMGMYPYLDSFINSFYSWLDEMKQQQDSFEPYNNSASDLNDYVMDYVGKKGGVFSNGVSYADFTSYMNKYWDNYGSSQANLGYAFLSMCYDAAKDCMEHFSKKTK